MNGTLDENHASVTTDRPRKTVDPERIKQLKRLYKRNPHALARALLEGVEERFEAESEETYWGQMCETCGHSRLNHKGFREPGCTYIGLCQCQMFKKSR